MLFNVYIYHQPTNPTIRNFIYANYVDISCQSQEIAEIEKILTETLSKLRDYIRSNQLRPNPVIKRHAYSTTHNHRQAIDEVQIEWNSVRLQPCPSQIYPGVTQSTVTL